MTESKIESKISEIDKRLTLLENEVFRKPKKLSKTTKHTGLAGAISELILENFFNTPRNLNEITEQLKSNGIFYPKTSYPESLLRLIRNKELRRIKENRKWMYVKNV